MATPDRRPVAVFDIDGTLTDTMGVDVECYEAAIRAELDLEIPADWPTFPDVTDATILATACERRGLPVPSLEVQARIAERLGALLAAELGESPHRFRPIPGASRVFVHLDRAGWRVAMATGAWRPSALVKLAGAGIPHEGVPLATASDHAERAAIIRHAVETASGGVDGPVVYVGDGVWDGRAARALGLAFVGVGPEALRADLKDAGAAAIVPDFEDIDSFLAHLDRIVS